jgi:hypothetical protein
MTKLRALLEECGIAGSTALTSAFGSWGAQTRSRCEFVLME